MMTNSELFGPIPAAPGNAASILSPEYSTASCDNGSNFLAVISQALNKNPGTQLTPKPPPAPSFDSSQVNFDDPSNSDDDTMESQNASDSAPNNGSQPSSPASSRNGDSIDPSVLSTIMALFAQPAVPPAELQKLTSVQGKDPKVTPIRDQLDAAKLNESGVEASKQKLSAPQLQSASGSLVNEPAGPDSKPAIRAAMKSLAEAGKPPPANIPPSDKEPPPTANTLKPPSALPQLTAAQDVPLAAQERLESAVPMDGIGAALNNQRMKFAAEKNEIAGRAVQKLPDASSADAFSDGLPAKTDAQSAPDLSAHTRDSFDSNLLIDLSAKSSMSDLMQAKLAEKTQPADTAASQVERVAHLVSQEVLTVRQSGASSLAVSLKVDSHTELFLQLTNHDGQVQASIRCERGNIDALGSHWGDLQASLGRQNVQLLPLQDKGSFRDPASNSQSDPSFSRTFDQPSNNPQRQGRAPREESSMAVATAVAPSSRKTKTNNPSRQGWETWA